VSGPLAGLRVVDLSNTLTSAHASGLLADFGAEVVHVEPPGGSPLRSQPAYPFWARGKQSIVLDLHDADDQRTARELALAADVVIETFRPGVVERFGLGYDQLAPGNPRLVFASVTAFGRTGPYAQVKGYDGLMMALLGGHNVMGAVAAREGPAYCAVPYGSWSAAQTVLHGILTALYERESSGVGQRVDTTMVQAFAGHDPWNALIFHMVSQFPEAFSAARLAEPGADVPDNPLFFRLAVALTKDGRWLQFSQTTQRLFEAFMRLLELDWMFDDPEWAAVPDFDDAAKRGELFDIIIAKVRAKTVDEWMVEFDREPNVWAEIFRHGTELLDHPQLVHDRSVIVIDDAARGAVRQPGPMVRLATTPGVVERSAPALDEHGPIPLPAAGSTPPPGTAPASTLPLAGVTVLELGTYYAAPYGTTVLTDLGARVIKIEQLDGDPIRHIIPFPEVGAVKVLQGKESVAVDIHTDEGREIVHELVRRADAVMASFRAGAVERVGLDPDTLLALNPALVYLSAPGYGVDGPCGHRPAFAPTIGAGSGMAYRNVGDAFPESPDLQNDEVRRAALRINTAAMVVGQADGFSALGVGTALLLGLLVRERGGGGQAMNTSMLLTMAHVLGEDMLEYEGRLPYRGTDAGQYGLHALYRLYETADGWVFLAAGAPSEWAPFTKAVAAHVDLAGDARFVDADARAANGAALADVLGAMFASRAASDWESDLLPQDVGCMAVRNVAPEAAIYGPGGLGELMGWTIQVEHPVVGTHPRLTPLVEFSRSQTVVKSSVLCGADTDAVLGEIGYDADRIASLRDAGVIL
jgi:crotonobetainyl-CoA:carnitine CoA-transferase CaiB-like acyl-CoA transferase